MARQRPRKREWLWAENALNKAVDEIDAAGLFSFGVHVVYRRILDFIRKEERRG